MASFPATVVVKPTNITDGLQILAAHVGTAWDEIVSLENELLGSGAGSFIMDLRPSSAGSVVLQSRQLAGDTQARFQLTGSGDQKWGSGSATTDVTLSRSTTRTLTLTGAEIFLAGNAADIPLTAKGTTSQTGALIEAKDTSNTVFFRITAGGQLVLSPTSTPTTAAFGMQFGNDTFANLYRSAASTLKMDGALIVSSTATVNNVAMVGAGAGIASTNTVVGNPFLRALVSGDSQDRLDVYHDGSMKWGPGGVTATDTTLARTGVGVLGLTGALTVSGTITATGGVTVATLLTAPTKAVDTNTSDVATTAFVLAQAGAVTPTTVDDTAAVVGTSTRFARADHRHKLNSGIYDTTGVASRLNPMRILCYFEQYGGDIDSFGFNGHELRMDLSTGWEDQGVGLTASPIPWDRAGLAAIGGTVQWRWQFVVVVTTAATTCAFNARYLLVTDSGGVGTLTGVGGGVSGATVSAGTGSKYFDSGWLSAPGNQGFYIPSIRFDKTGTNFVWSRSQLIVDVRNV